MTHSPMKLIVGLGTTSLLYFFVTVYLFLFFDAITIDVFTSPNGFIDRLVSVWIVFGTLLTIADLLAIWEFISGMTSNF